MEWLSNLNPSSLLAIGGIGALSAGIFAGWNQVKVFFSYISSFIIIIAEFKEGLQFPVRFYIRKNYKTLPSSKYFYLAPHTYEVRPLNKFISVPFRLNPSTTLYYRGLSFVIVSDTESNITATTLRGFINFNRLVIIAQEEYEKSLDEEADNISRFSITFWQGREKFGRGSNKYDADESVEPAQSVKGGSVSSNNSSSHIPLDFSIDVSFRFHREQYIWTENYNPFQGLFFDLDIDRYINQAQQWLNMRQWYSERNIPWRKGWLLYGPPGTGKSSIALAVAKKLKIPLIVFDLASMSDQELTRKWDSLPARSPCIVLFEDFDTVFNKRENLTEHKSLSFETILNCLSGVRNIQGIFTIITTNHLEKIDEAIGIPWKDGITTRPGRIDTAIHIGYMSKANRYKLASTILKDWPEEIPNVVNYAEDMTPVQVQEISLQIAFKRLANHYNMEKAA